MTRGPNDNTHSARPPSHTLAGLTSPCLGIEIGGTKLQIVIGSGTGEITDRWRATVDPAAGGTGIQTQIRAGIAALLGTHSPAAVGVGFGGPVDWRSGRIRRSHQIDGWEGFELGAWLEDITGVPVAVDNDANVAALGEARHAAVAALDPVFYVTLGSGVGGGLVVGGMIYHGRPPGEAEFGHLRLDRAGATVESRCSGWAIDTRLRTLAAERTDSILARLLGDRRGGEARHWSAAVTARDPGATALLAEVTDDLGFALSHVVHLFHPAVIVLGGGLSLVGEPLRAGVAAALPRYLIEAFKPAPDVRLAALGEDAVPVGALQLASRECLSRTPPANASDGREGLAGLRFAADAAAGSGVTRLPKPADDAEFKSLDFARRMSSIAASRPANPGSGG